MTAWQPIETAPKDGSLVIVYRPPPSLGVWDRVVLARWFEVYPDTGEPAGNWFWYSDTGDVWDEAEFEDAIVHDDAYEANNFTHWMPLPDPPDETPPSPSG